MTGPLISIIIPTYNRAAMLLRTLESVKRQTWPEWEAIVIDDGSTDDTRSLFEAGAQDRRIHYVRQANAGVSAARNTGLRVARGEFIAFLDSDDLWRPWKLEAQVRALQQYPDVGMVWTDMEAIDGDDGVLTPHYLRRFYTSYQWFTNEDLFSEHRPFSGGPGEASMPGVLHTGQIYSAMLTGNLVHTSTVMLRRSRLATVGQFDESIRPSGEDYEFHLRTCREGLVGFLDVVSTSYRIGEADQLTKPGNAAALAERFLLTATTALKRDRDRVEIRHRPLVRRALRDGYRWAAEEYLKAGNTAQARRRLLQAAGYEPYNVRTLAMLGMSLLPLRTSIPLRAAYRSVKASVMTAVSAP